MTLKFVAANNAATTVGSNVAPGDTTITLAAGGGAVFPTIVGAEQYAATLVGAGSTTGVPNEIVYVTGASGDVLTVVRAREGTAAQAWPLGSAIANLWTAGQLASLAQEIDVQSQSGNYAVDTGTANAGAVTLTPAPANMAVLTGVPIRVKKVSSPNTGAYTLNVNGLGATPITWQGQPLVGGSLLGIPDLPGLVIFEVVYDGVSAFDLDSGPGVVTNGRLAQAPAYTIKGNNTGAQAADIDMTVAQLLAMPGFIITPPIGQFRNQQASGGASGESLAAGSWHQRVLNTTVVNTIGGASLSGNEVTLPAGTYTVSAFAYAQCATSQTSMGHKLRIYNVTDSAVLVDGSNAAYAGGANNNVVVAPLQGVFSLPGIRVVEVDSFIQLNSATGGIALNTGDPEIYVDVVFTKIA